MTEVPFADLPTFWQQEIRDLRRDNQKMRHERNEARDALATATIAFANASVSK